MNNAVNAVIETVSLGLLLFSILAVLFVMDKDVEDDEKEK